MKYNLHKSVPNWMIKAVTGSACNECNESIYKEDILGLGVKEINKEGSVSIFVEYQCHGCNHAARMNFSSQTGRIEEMCYLLLDEIQKKRRVHKSRELDEEKRPKSQVAGQITDEETKRFVKSMNDLESFDDFLKLIGASNLVENENSDDKPNP